MSPRGGPRRPTRKAGCCAWSADPGGWCGQPAQAGISWRPGRWVPSLPDGAVPISGDTHPLAVVNVLNRVRTELPGLRAQVAQAGGGEAVEAALSAVESWAWSAAADPGAYATTFSDQVEPAAVARLRVQVAALQRARAQLGQLLGAVVGPEAVAGTRRRTARWRGCARCRSGWTRWRSVRRSIDTIAPCQGVKGHQELPVGGHEICPVAANKTARWRPWDLPRGRMASGPGLRWGVADGAGWVAQPAGARATAGQGGCGARSGHASRARRDASLSIFIRQSRTLRNVGGRAHAARVAMPTLPEVLLLGVSVPGVAGAWESSRWPALAFRVDAAAWGVT
jgi:hypothetical protein